MSLSALKMYCKKNNTTYPVDLYTSSQETGTQTNLCKKIVTGMQSNFFRLSTYLQNGAAGGDTPMRVKLNDTVYKVTQHGEFKITITPAENQTITCTANGITWTSGTKWFPYGTKWTATIKGHAGYNPGTLNVSSGTLTNNDVTITATAATLAIPTGNITFPPDRCRHDWVCPPYITRIKCSTQKEADKYYSVIPGVTYQFQMVVMGEDNNAWFMIKNNKSKQVTDNGYYSLMVSWGPDINNHT